MILRFTTADMLNTALVDSGTGTAVFSIVTRRLDEEEDKPESVVPLRKTWIYDSSGRVVGEITWTGRQPTDFVVAEESIGSLKHLFGTSIVRFLWVPCAILPYNAHSN
jgi:hypothetical protein